MIDSRILNKCKISLVKLKLTNNLQTVINQLGENGEKELYMPWQESDITEINYKIKQNVLFPSFLKNMIGS